MIYTYLTLKFDQQPIPGVGECRWRTNDDRDMGGEGELVYAMNELGKEGWEAISCQGIQNVSYVVFKRSRQTTEGQGVRPVPLAELSPEERVEKLRAAGMLVETVKVENAPPRRGRPPKTSR